MEEVSELILEAKVSFLTHYFFYILVVESCRYDFLLEMPWQVAKHTKKGYLRRVFKVKDYFIPLFPRKIGIPVVFG